MVMSHRISVPVYNIKQYKLDSARTNFLIEITGDHLAVWTDGTLAGCSINIDAISEDSIPLDKFNSINIPLGFRKIYLTTSIQPGKTLYVFIGRAAGVGLGGNPVNVNPSSPLQSLLDIKQELVGVRSIYPSDGLGDVVWSDDFESGSLGKWTSVASAIPGTQSPSADTSKGGAFSAKLLSALAPPSSSGLYVYRPLPRDGLFGVEISFTLSTGMSWLTIDTIIDDGKKLSDFGIRYSHSAHTLSYLNKSVAWELIDDTNIHGFSSWFHTIKLVCDSRKNEYFKCILDGKIYSLVGISPETLGSLSPPVRWSFSVSAYWPAAVESIYIDDAIMTLE